MEQHLSPNPTEIELLQRYIARRMENGGANSVDELVSDFRQYQRQLNDARAKVKEAEESHARGESGPLDLDSILDRARQLAK